MTDTAEKRAEPTPGPWHIVNPDEAVHEWVIGDSEGGSIADFSPPGPWMPDDVATANMRLVLAAVNTVPDTAAERDRLQAANAKLVETLEILRDQWCHGNCLINDNGDGDHEDECNVATATLAKAKEPSDAK